MNKNLSGGRYINIKINQDNLYDDINILDFHGSLINDIFKIPNNIILSIQDTCGVSSYGHSLYWYYGFKPFNYQISEKDEINFFKSNPKQISKDYFTYLINDFNGNFYFGPFKYVTLYPGSYICDFNLSTYRDDSDTIGIIKSKFNTYDSIVIRERILNINKIEFMKKSTELLLFIKSSYVSIREIIDK